MKRACITTISFAILVLGIIGCTSSAPTTVTPADVPSLSKNEVCAIVYNYLQSEIQGITFIGVSQGLQNAISNARSSCSTTYVGEGQWSVNALGYGYYSEEEKWYFYHTGGKLIPELDHEYEVNVDDLAGKRRYMPNEASADKYRYYTRDQQGSVVMLTDHDQNEEEYKLIVITC